MPCIACYKISLVNRHRYFVEHNIVFIRKFPIHRCTINTKTYTNGIQRCNNAIFIKMELSTTQHFTIFIKYFLIVHWNNPLLYNKV